MRIQGIVRWFSEDRGFGFIRSVDGGEDYIVHRSAIEQGRSSSLAEGNLVEFNGAINATGRHALAVVKL